MSGLMKSAMGFEVNMDDEFADKICNILGLLESGSSGVAGCELRKVAESNSWIIEFFGATNNLCMLIFDHVNCKN